MGILKDIMLELKSKEKVLIFSTHQMEEAERLCDRICLINKGRRVLEGSVRDVKAQYSNDRVTLSFEGQDTFLDDRDLVQKYDNYGNYVEVELKPGREPQELLERAMKMATVQRFEVSEPSLRDIFISEVGGDASEVLSDA
jgi:ABC-2 type transport system ATP-binding protein